MKTITFDQKSIVSIASGQIDVGPFCSDWTLPLTTDITKCVVIEGHAFVISRAFQPNDALLTLSMLEDGPLIKLSIGSREEAFGRIIRCASRIISGQTRSIPAKWHPFHNNNLLSFQADRFFRNNDGGKTDAGRIVVETSQKKGVCIFAFLLERGGYTELSDVIVNRVFHEEALGLVAKALASEDIQEAAATLTNSVTLDNELEDKLKGHLSTEDWYLSRLTIPQRRFVDHPLTTSIRLVGPAGTGKTRALVIKCISEAKSDEKKRFLFLTHAVSTAEDVEDMIGSMEPENREALLSGVAPRIMVTTLYGISDDVMQYGLSKLETLTIDGHEGKSFQADVLNEAIEEYKSGNWIVYMKKCSEPFQKYMASDVESGERKFFLWELMNEFACVLDAEGVKSSALKKEQYLAEKRKNWMMELSGKEERNVVLDLYDVFRRKLREMKVIGSDQMITDFLNHLDTFKWEATRESYGFDAIFVDELHLFNRQERMVFRHLLKMADGTPSVMMAYDAKQSPRDTFLQLPSMESQNLDLWKDAKLGVVEKIELVEVFRYTPEITKVLGHIDENYPGQNLDDDWPKYSGISQISSGPTPIAFNLESTNAINSVVFKRAKARQKELGKSGKVAILCVSNQKFLKYLKYSAFQKDYMAITSRDDASSIPKASRQFVFSMPEYVAGLQFDTVYIIDANKNEVPEGAYAAASARKFISQLYLGASRAERVLEFFSCAEDGGLSQMLSIAIHAQSIEQVTSLS